MFVREYNASRKVQVMTQKLARETYELNCSVGPTEIIAGRTFLSSWGRATLKILMINSKKLPRLGE